MFKVTFPSQDVKSVVLRHILTIKGQSRKELQLLTKGIVAVTLICQNIVKLKYETW